MLLVVLASGCKYTSRQEPGSVATAQDDGAGGSPAVPAHGEEGASQAGPPGTKPGALKVEVLRMKRMLKQDLPLAQDQLSAFVSGVGRTTLTAVAERRQYDLQLRLVSEGEAQEWSGDLWCCELRATNPELPFVWAVWSEEVMLNFRVVSSPSPVSYAAWVEGGTLCFEEIRTSRDAETALAPFVSQCARRLEDGSLTWGSSRLPVAAQLSSPDATAVVCVWISTKMGSGDFVPGRGRSNAGLDIRAQSIARDETGQWTVKVKGRHPRRIYTYVSPDGVTWERK